MAEHPTPSEPAPRVSVVVCTHNGADILGTALAAIRRQQLAAGLVELIVVDDGSTDGSSQIAAAAGARVSRFEASVGLSAARNAGVVASSAPLVVFTDDDCEPRPDWLQKLIEPFDDRRVQGVGGRTVPESDDTVLFRFLRLRNPLSPLPASLLCSTNPLYRLRRYLLDATGPVTEIPAGAALYAVAGANMAFRRDLLDALGGFDARIKFAGEEEDLCRRAHLHDPDTLLVYQPSAVVAHHFKPDVKDTIRRSRSYGRGNARAAVRDGRAPIVFPVPVLAAAAAATAAAQRSRWLALAASVPFVGYPGWVAYAFRNRRPESLAYPLLQFCQETATMLGEAEYYLRPAVR